MTGTRFLGPTRIALALLFATSLAGPASADDDAKSASNIGEALKKGTVSLDLRYRYEWVSEDAFDQDAGASTLRTALGYRTLPLHGVSAYLEFENVKVLGSNDSYNNKGEGHLWNGVGDRPVVADPQITEVNQAYLDVAFADTIVRVGRQVIALDDERFIGPVGWRQNFQTFDAATVTTKDISHLALTYGFIQNVNTIFGGDKKMASHILHGAIDVGKAGSLNAFAYLLDYDDEADWALSRSTYGLHFAGSPKLNDDWKLVYDAAYAVQNDYGDNPVDVSAHLLRVDLGAGFRMITFRVGDEILSAGDDRFLTPLATLHKWDGWADKFLATPANGIDDLYASVAGKHGDFAWVVAYHDFSSDEGSDDYGTEFDAQATYKAKWGQVFGLKAASYSADSFSTDTDKVWLFTSYKF